MRSIAREVVFKYTFSKLFNPTDEELFSVLKKDASLNADDSAFADKLLKYSVAGTEKYSAVIEESSKQFKLNRIFPADKCILIMGMAEMDNFPETPTIVIIDEATKLAAKFTTERSPDFVNGIIAEYAKNTDRKF